MLEGLNYDTQEKLRTEFKEYQVKRRTNLVQYLENNIATLALNDYKKSNPFFKSIKKITEKRLHIDDHHVHKVKPV